MLSELEVRTLALSIFEQHEQCKRFRPIPELIPTIADAHDVQDAYVRLLLEKNGATIGGYKIALTSQQTRDWLKVYEPCAGQVLSTRIHYSPHTVLVSEFTRFSVETEVGVILDRDLSGPCTTEDVRQRVRSLHSAYELIEDRDADLTQIDAKSLASDNSWNAGVVLGPAGPNDVDLTNRRGRLKVNGIQTQEGTTAETMNGNPLEAVAWLAQHLGKRGKVIKAGEPILTGSIIQSQFIEPGNNLEFALDGLPPVHLSLI